MNKAIVFALSFTSFAAWGAEVKTAPTPVASKSFSRPYGMAGCGLGSMVMGKSGGQIFASTTNYTAYNQFFAITLGTSNCVDNPNDKVASRMDKFVNGNRAAIAMDIARGDGETVASLSKLAGCRDSAYLGTALQKQFTQIFPSHTVQPNEITDSIITVIRSDDSLTAACSQVI